MEFDSLFWRFGLFAFVIFLIYLFCFALFFCEAFVTFFEWIKKKEKMYERALIQISFSKK